MANKYSEDTLTEQTCIEIFNHQLHQEIADVYQGETFGEAGTIGRISETDVILKRYFYKAIEKLNPNLPKQTYDLGTLSHKVCKFKKQLLYLIQYDY